MSADVVTSLNNRWVKLCQAVALSAKDRKLSGKALIEGIHLVDSYMASPLSISASTSDVMLLTERSTELSEVSVLLKRWQGDVITVSEKVFKAISQLGNGPELAVLMTIPLSPVPLLNSNRDIVYLCGLQDPGNVGTIIRSAVAAGISQIACSPKTVSLWSPKVLRSAMGGHFHVTLVEDQGLDEILGFSAKNKIVVRAMAAQAPRSLFQADVKATTCWLLGSEGQGLPFDELTNSGHIIDWLSIPQQNVESLNVASASAVCFYEQWRQRNVAS